YDYLELYHVERWIWRTKLGEHIVKNFIEPYANFGFPKQSAELQVMIYNIMCQKYMVVDKLSDYGTCYACKLKRKLSYIIHFDGSIDPTYSIGADCNLKINYLRTVGQLIQRFRATSQFNLKLAITLLPQL